MSALNIIVCVKQILDPEIPARDFRIDAAGRQAERGSANLVTNIFCENAIETALQYRERFGGKITAVCFGAAATAEDVLRKALALKVDEGVLVVNDAAPHPDPLYVARVLAAAVRKIGGCDLLLTGREAGDWGAGQTGLLLAEELRLACIAFVDQLEPGAAGPRSLQVRRQTDSGSEVFEASLPLVVTITNNDHNVPRLPKTRDVMQSFKRPITRWQLADLAIDSAEPLTPAGYYEVVELFIPRKESQCEFVAGDTLDAKVEAFAQCIAGVIHGS